MDQCCCSIKTMLLENRLADTQIALQNALKEAIEPPESMLDKWRDAHGYFVEKAAWVKQMLAL